MAQQRRTKTLFSAALRVARAAGDHHQHVSAQLQRVLGAALWLWLAGFTLFGLDDPIGDGDECRHAMVLRQMVRSSEYFRPTLDGGGYLDPGSQARTDRRSVSQPVPVAFERPLLPYWLAAPLASLVPGEIGVRLSSALLSFLTLIVVFVAARHCWGRGDAAFVATVLLAGSPSFHAYSRSLMSEPLLVLASTIAVSSAVAMRRDPRFVIGAGLGIGIAFAAKSLAAVIPALALAPWLWHGWLRAEPRARALAVVALLATAAPYYVLSVALHGMGFVDAHFASLGGRVVHAAGVGLPGGVLAYVTWMFEADGGVAVAWLALGTLGALALGVRRRNPELLLLGGYAATVIAIMSLLAMRLPHYILPAFPAAALAVGGLYAELIARSPLDRAWLAPLLGPALALAVLLEGNQHPGGYAYLLQRPTSRDLGLVARQVAAPGQTLYVYQWYGPALEYYAERPVELLTDEPKALALVSGFVRATRLVPPPPAPPGSRILIVAEPETLAHSSWLRVETILARSPPIVLAVARVVP